MMSNVYFFTGFPGYIATQLIKDLVKRENVHYIYLLTLPQLKKQAEEQMTSIANAANFPNKHWKVIEGDITKANLHLKNEVINLLKNTVTHVFHLAAIYDLAVEKNIAYTVNVTGTKNVNQFVKNLERLKRYIYFSTAYVAGKREGKILETELDKGQDFKNYYEETKFKAEVEVQKIINQVPTTIFRPGVVFCHSVTGETMKFDGLYFMLNFFDRMKHLPMIPYLGRGDVEGNFVPIDYIVSATMFLSHEEIGVGKTYHLTDPKPYKMREIYKMMLKEYTGKTPIGTLPISLTKAFLSIPLIRKWLRVEKEALDYFMINTQYDCSIVQEDLKHSGIQCPDLKDVIKNMIDYYRIHKEDPTKQIKIR